jgi:hypothetical protein
VPLFQRDNPSPSPASAPAGQSPRDPLDTPLLELSPTDHWTIRDACEGVQIFGAIGSGKTTGSGAALAMRYLQHGFGGLVCCAKPEERALWQGYMRDAGRLTTW